VEPIVERAPPKVNLTLQVLGRRPDGYHALDSLVAFAHDLADTVTLLPGVRRPVETRGPFGHTIAGPNLITVTLDRVAAAAPDLTLGAVVLEKNLPVAAGIGGGSADAAAVLRAIQRVNGATARGVDWFTLAATLGADVPVCLTPHAQRMQGVGNQLTSISHMPDLCAVLANPQVAVPADKTAQVFRTLACPPLGAMQAPAEPAWTDRASLIAHMRTVGNDLLAPARTLVPAIDHVLSALASSPGAELAQLSGGGPTCFGIYPDMIAANAAAEALSAAHPAWWVRASRLA
jgi:4-diphosphocytidyl-2-C-methyl-D-erythritol kinase